MNKKGFTLVEVILVIVIMAILLLILVPNVLVLLNKNNKKACENLKDNIASATKMYVTNNKYDLGFSCSNNAKDITLKTLIDTDYLKSDSSGKITNPIDDSLVPLTTTVTVTYDCNNNNFTYTVNGIDCTK